ncbi:hypothetical protein ACLB2K_011902 [Fragaria x ananassa]
MVDSACGCTFMNKIGRQAYNLIEDLADNNRQFSTKNSRKSAGGRGGVYDMEARNQMITLDRKLDVLVKAFNGSNLGNQACGICSLSDHSTNSCPNGALSEAELNFMGQQRQCQGPRPSGLFVRPQVPQGFVPNSSNFVPNFVPNNANVQSSNNKASSYTLNYDEILKSLAQGQQNLTSATQALVTGQQANSKEITELKKQMGQVIDFIGKIHESGKLSGQTLPNPNAGQFRIVTTRSGRVFEEPLLKKSEPSKEGEAENVFLQDDEDIEEVYAKKQPDKKAVPQFEREATVPAEKKKVQEAEPLAVPADPKSTQAVLEKGKSSSSNGLVSTNVYARAPFPNRFAKSKHDEADHAMIELFKKVEVNMPLLECIQQNPKYAKFLKELCTNKRLPREKDVAVMNETIFAVFQGKLPPKLKDPGSFSIPCTIGTHSFDKIMLDLGASINVMPSYLYANLGLGELKKDNIIIRLADRSNKIPLGYVEDVLVQVASLTFPADFYVIDMEPADADDKEIPILLGRPFMRTARTKINVYSGELSFEIDGDIISYNIFDAMRYLLPELFRDSFSIDVVDDLADEYVETIA